MFYELFKRFNKIEEALSKNEKFYFYNNHKYSIKKFDILFYKYSHLIFILNLNVWILRYTKAVYSVYSGFKAFCFEAVLVAGVGLYVEILLIALYELYCSIFTKNK